MYFAEKWCVRVRCRAVKLRWCVGVDAPLCGAAEGGALDFSSRRCSASAGQLSSKRTTLASFFCLRKGDDGLSGPMQKDAGS